MSQLSLFDAGLLPKHSEETEAIRSEILNADLSRMTPIEALNMLCRLQELARETQGGNRL